MERSNIYKIYTGRDMPAKVGNESLPLSFILNGPLVAISGFLSGAVTSSLIVAGMEIAKYIDGKIKSWRYSNKELLKEWSLLEGKMDSLALKSFPDEQMEEILKESSFVTLSSKFDTFKGVTDYYSNISFKNGLSYLDKCLIELGQKNPSIPKDASVIEDRVKELVTKINPKNDAFFGEEVANLDGIKTNGKGQLIPTIMGVAKQAYVYKKEEDGLDIKKVSISANSSDGEIKCSLKDYKTNMKTLISKMGALTVEIQNVATPLKKFSDDLKKLEPNVKVKAGKGEDQAEKEQLTRDEAERAKNFVKTLLDVFTTTLDETSKGIDAIHNELSSINKKISAKVESMVAAASASEGDSDK